MRRLLVVATSALALLSLQLPGASAGEPVLRLDFDQAETLQADSLVQDASGGGHHGVVRTSGGGVLALTSGTSSSRAADFPRPCSSVACPKAVVQVPDRPSLDPGRRAFAFGASVRLETWETSDGSNVIQKGLWRDVGGQWKLQVDGHHGRPSCVISGRTDGRRHRVVVRSSTGIADGRWHAVSCRRTASTVEVVVDGTTTGRAAMPAVELSSGAAVLIGGKNHDRADNDQFFGAIDDVFVRRE